MDEIFQDEKEREEQKEREQITKTVAKQIRQNKGLKKYLNLFIKLLFWVNLIYNILCLLSTFSVNFYGFVLFISNFYFLLGYWRFKREKENAD